MTVDEVLKAFGAFDRGASVLLKVGNDWCEVTGVIATGEHRNAVTLNVINDALDGGVIVVEPDLP